MLRQGINSLAQRHGHGQLASSSQKSSARNLQYCYYYYCHRTPANALSSNDNCIFSNFLPQRVVHTKKFGYSGLVGGEIEAIKFNYLLDTCQIPKIKMDLITSSSIHQSKLSNNGIYRNPKRLFSSSSTQDKATNNGAKVGLEGELDGAASSSGGGFSGGDKHGINAQGIVLGALGLTATCIALAVAGDNSDAMSQIQGEQRNRHREEYDEWEVEDHIERQMEGVHHEIRGKITEVVLGEDAAQQLAKESELRNTAEIISDMISSDALQNAIARLVTKIVSSSQFQNACQTLLKNLWHDLVNDPETTAQVVALLNTAIKDEKIKKSVKELVLGLLQDEEVYNQLTDLVVKLGEDREVLDATKELLTESAHKALNDPEILDHSMEFAADVVGDNVLQQTSGEALRNTVTYAVRPSLSSFLSIFGVALLFFSVSALGQARSAARQGKEIDAAASVVARNLGGAALKSLTKILSAPTKAIAAIGVAIGNVLIAPFQIVRTLVISLSNTGSAAAAFIKEVGFRILASPGLFINSVRSAMGSLQVYTTNMLNNAVWYMSSMLNNAVWRISTFPQLLLSQTRTGINSLAFVIVSALKRTSKAIYSKAAEHLSQIFMLTRMSLAAVGGRCGNSFDIMIKNIVANGRWQISRFNDVAEEIASRVILAISNFFGRIGSTGKST